MLKAHAEPSVIENILINWASPAEIPIIKILEMTVGRKEFNKSFQAYFDNYGLVKGLWESKVDDYCKLIKSGSQKRKTRDRVLKLYNKTPCGIVMKVVYHIFR